METLEIPEDLLIHILIRLPVKSLVRFKSACKSWYYLINNLNFIAHHYNYNLTKGSLILVSCLDEIAMKINLCMLSNQSFPVKRDLDLPPPIKHRDDGGCQVEFLEAINGIFCVSFGFSLVLWNPATRESISLPSFVKQNNWKITLDDLFFGFGFDSKTTHDLKVVRIVVYSREVVDEDEDEEERIEDDCSWVVEVYSPTLSCWREIKTKLARSSCSYSSLDYSLPSLRSIGNPNSYVNGACHWWALTNSPMKGANVILSFDFSDEEFRSICLPSTLKYGVFVYHGQLTGLNGCLSLIVHTNGGRDIVDCFDLWVMNEYGVEESWTKMFTVGPFIGVQRSLGLFKNTELYLLFESNDRDLVCYEPKGREMKNLLDQGFPVQSVSYTESLFPIKAGN